MKLDSHQHFWQYTEKEYGWISGEMSVIRRDFYPEELAEEQRKAGYDGSIAVQARQSLEENEFLLGLAEHYDLIRGVVGWVDLRSEQVEDQLSRFAAHPKAVGVRHVLHDEPDDVFMLREDFRRGISKLRQFNMTYDLLLFPKHLKHAVKLVAEFPDQPFVLDHISKPFIKAGIISPWEEDIRRLAEFPNVSCKLSGMVTEANWKKWNKKDFYPYLDVVWEAFGEDRLMIGSDWPVCRVAGEYGKVMGIVEGYLRQFPKSSVEKVMGINCREFYL